MNRGGSALGVLALSAALGWAAAGETAPRKEASKPAAAAKASAEGPAGGEAAEGSAATAGDLSTVETPPEYGGPAHPYEDLDTIRRLARADQLLAGGEPLRAFDLIDEILARPSEGLITSDGVLYVPIHGAVARRFEALAPETLALYRRHYDAPARKAIDEALAALDPDRIEAAAARYAHTSAGLDAFESAGDLAWDRNALWRAIGDWSRAIELRPAIPRRARLEAKIVLALERAGSHTRARARLRDLVRELPEETVTLAGERVRVRDLPGHPLLQAAPAPRTSTAWPCAGGSPARTSSPAASEGALGWRIRWIHPPPRTPGAIRETIDEARKVESAGGPLLRLVRFPALMPASDGERIFLHGPDGVDFVDIRSGKLAQRAEVESPAVSGRATGNENYAWLGRHCVPNGMQEVTFDGEAVYATSAPASPPVRSRRSPPVFPSNLLYAIDARTAKIRWRLELKRPRGDATAGAAFLGPPVATSVGEPGRILVAPAVTREGPELVGISPAGKVLWRRALYGHEGGELPRFGSFGYATTPIAASSGFALAAPGEGAAVLVRARDGTIVWLSRYRSRIRRSYTDWRWAPSPPVLAAGPDGRLIALIAPFDSDYLTALRVETGEILWERAFDSGGWILLGADAERVYAAGRGVAAFRLRDGAPAWSAPECGPVSGRGFLARDAIVVPLRGSIARIDPGSGRVLETVTFRDRRIVPPDARWPDRVPPLIPGSLIATGSGLVACAPWGLAAIEPIAASAKRQGGVDGVLQLAARARFGKALALARRMLEGSEVKDRSAIRNEIVRIAIEAAARTGKPAFLEGIAVLAGSRAEAMMIELERARRLAPTAPEEAAEILSRALSESSNATVPLFEGRSVRVGSWAGAFLRDLVRAGRIPPIPEAEAAVGTALSDPAAEATALRRILRRAPHATRAAELIARLAKAAEAKGWRDRAAAYWEQAAADPRSPAAAEALERLARDLDPSSARILLEEYAMRHGEEEVPGQAGKRYREVAAALLRRLPPPAIPDPPVRPALRFWKKIEDAVPCRAEGAPLPAIPLRKGDRLLLLDRDGEPAGEGVLADWPDLSGVPKEALRSFPASDTVYHREGGIFLATGAGIYCFAQADGRLKLLWRYAMEHPVAAALSGGARQWQVMNMIYRGQVQPPEPRWTREGLLVRTTGKVHLVDPASGKARFVRSVDGPILDASGPWAGWVYLAAAQRVHRLELASGRLPMPYRLDRILEGEKIERIGPGRVGSTLVLETGGRVIALDRVQVRVSWHEGGGGARPWVVWTEPSRTWLIRPSGWIGCVETETGRTIWKVPFDEGYLARAAWRIPGGIIVALTRTRPVRLARGGAADLAFMAMDLEGRIRWRRTLAVGTIAFDPRSVLRGPTRWLVAFNVSMTDESSRLEVATLDPASGAVEVVLRRPFEAQGGTTAPVVVPVEGGVAIGTADGVGLIAEAPPEGRA